MLSGLVLPSGLNLYNVSSLSYMPEEQRQAADRPRAFLATVAGGHLVARLGQGRVECRLEHRLACGRHARAVPPDRGLADLHRLRLDAELRPRDVAARRRRARPGAHLAELRRAARAAEGDAGLDLPLRHRLEREERALGRRADHRHLRPRATGAGSGRARVRLRGVSVRRLPHDEAGAAPRRDARVRDGRQAAAARARRTAAARDPRDVRLQERQVAEPDRARAQAEDGYWEHLGYDRDAWVGRSNGYKS